MGAMHAPEAAAPCASSVTPRKPPGLMDPSASATGDGSWAWFKPYHKRLGVVLAVDRVLLGISMLNPFLIKWALDDGLLKRNDTILTETSSG